MEKREKIIVILLSIVLAYGAYAFLFSGDGSKVDTVAKLVKPEDLEKIKKKVQETVSKDPLSELEQYRIAVAERSWTVNPFYDRSKDLPKEDKKKSTAGLPEGVTLTYSGFISDGHKIYAIINGMEYLEGDELDVAGFYVKTITEKKIVVGQKDENGNILDQLEFFLDEQAF